MESTPTAPVSATAPIAPATSTAPAEYLPASVWKRLLNYILDGIFSVIFVFAISFIIGLAGTKVGNWSSLIGILLSVAYFTICEALWQRTVAKFITGTKVVMRDGSKPPFMNILGRSFARIIPFDSLSFLFNKYPVGWHDALSKTVVVSSICTPADVQKMDFARIKKEHAASTVGIVMIIIILLLVVIAIIGVLSSVVLVSLNTARQKGNDMRAISVVSQLRSVSEGYFGEHNTYTEAQNCNSGMFKEQIAQQILTLMPLEHTASCIANGTSYAISTSLKDGRISYCLDSTGKTDFGAEPAVQNGNVVCAAK
ncbi:MAG: RDD family protein [Patescibacteria group bacterium]